jgi:hypothetical protein
MFIQTGFKIYPKENSSNQLVKAITNKILYENYLVY